MKQGVLGLLRPGFSRSSVVACSDQCEGTHRDLKMLEVARSQIVMEAGMLRSLDKARLSP